MTTPVALPLEEGIPSVDDSWLAVHVFYTGNQRPLLGDCLKPLFASLLDDGLITRYFFLNYWLQGPHVRVRFKPVSEAAAHDVKERADCEIGGFLRRRPSLYQVDQQTYAEMTDDLFALEFTPEQRRAHLDANGTMRLRPNNSMLWTAYEPEYDKYGGPEGVRLAEWHFMRSTDMVMDSLDVMNLHLRSVLLGHAAQAMMVMSRVFLIDDELIHGFFENYRRFWSQAHTGEPSDGSEFDATFEPLAEGVRARYAAICAAIDSDDLARLPGTLGMWARHCGELRRRVGDHARTGQLVFPTRDHSRRTLVTDPAEAVGRLLHSYMHVTNNRLMLNLSDEAYLGHVLCRTAGDAASRTGSVAPGTGSARASEESR